MMIRKFFITICLLLSSATCFSLMAQDEVTDAFQDLKRTGAVGEEASEMRLEAVGAELDKLLAENPTCNYFVFTEDRVNDIRMTNALPQKWMSRTPMERVSYEGEATPGEYYYFQLGVFAPYQDLENISLQYSNLENENGVQISKNNLNCINIEATDTDGQPFLKKTSVKVGTLQALWVGINIPTDAKGKYRGQLTLKPQNADAQIVNLSIVVKGNPLPNQGDDEGWRKSRLRWLNSKSGHNNTPTAPYTALTVKNNTINYLGGSVELNSKGLPKQIITNYTANNNLDAKTQNKILANQVSFIIENSNKENETLSQGELKFTKQNADVVCWESKMESPSFELLCEGRMYFDGRIEYSLLLKSLKDASVNDIKLYVPYAEENAKYSMGLGRKGGYRADSLFNWKWDRSKNQDKIWLGNINAGLNLCFKDENYKRPLVNVYYNLGRLELPKSWDNDGQGGIVILPSENKTVALQAYSGARELAKNEKLYFNVDLLITPVKPLDLNELATNRFYHSNSDLSENYIAEAKKAGANFINVHHKKDIYPFINYPYSDESIDDFKKFIDESHKNDIGVRVYYTTRELTIKIPELWALRSLGSEVIHDGPGKYARTLIHRSGPNEWLNRNLGSNFIPAWYNAFKEGKYKGDMDISVITTPDSRWNNYYLAGLEWMVENIGLDGVYIDDSALDYKTLRRARRILDRDSKKRMIDLHSWNHMNRHAGHANSLHMYLELLPYVDRIWIGEGFSEKNELDFWLVEMSGIPFGMFSETLDAKNRFRGMVFGMLPRLPWSGNPTPLWKLWDSFGMKDASISGFWDKQNPVSTNNQQVYATTYLNADTAMIALANWTTDMQSIKIEIDEKKLGFKPSKISIPHIENLQEEKASTSSLTFDVEGSGGLILILSK